MSVKGFDTITQILTQAQVNTLLNNSYYPAVFVGRYLRSAPGSSVSKHLTAAEINLLKNNNIRIVSLFEYQGSPASYYNAVVGNTHAADAISAANCFTQPASTPIYFCVDCSTSPYEISHYIIPYFTAIQNKLNNAYLNPNGYTMGIYGNAYACYRLKQEFPSIKAMVTGNLTQYGITFTEANIIQNTIGVDIQYNGTHLTVDKDTAFNSYGGWFPTGDPGPL